MPCYLTRLTNSTGNQYIPVVRRKKLGSYLINMPIFDIVFFLRKYMYPARFKYSLHLSVICNDRFQVLGQTRCGPEEFRSRACHSRICLMTSLRRRSISGCSIALTHIQFHRKSFKSPETTELNFRAKEAISEKKRSLPHQGRR